MVAGAAVEMLTADGGTEAEELDIWAEAVEVETVCDTVAGVVEVVEVE